VESVLMMTKLSTKDRQQFGLNGRAYAKQEFSRALAMDRLEVFFQETLDISRLKD